MPSRPPRELGTGTSYLALGMTFAAGIVAFSLGGLVLDRWLGVLPLFTITGAIAGSVLSFLHVYWKLKAEERK